jgi:hypothetical protein
MSGSYWSEHGGRAEPASLKSPHDARAESAELELPSGRPPTVEELDRQIDVMKTSSDRRGRRTKVPYLLRDYQANLSHGKDAVVVDGQVLVIERIIEAGQGKCIVKTLNFLPV